MVASCYINRRRGFTIIPSSKPDDQGLLGQKLETLDEEDPLSEDYDDLTSSGTISTKTGPKKRNCCGAIVHTPDTSRYANYWHSRFIQKFPFLVEIFYWAVNLLFYVSVKAASELIFATDGVWKTAESHGIAVLNLEHDSIFSFLFPVKEVDVQMWFRTDHQVLLTILNRAYSLIHIPVTVRYVDKKRNSSGFPSRANHRPASLDGTTTPRRPTPSSPPPAA